MRAMDARRWRRMAVLLLGTSLGACEVDPEDPLFLYGRVEHADGSSAPGTTVAVDRSTVRAPSHLPDPRRALDWELLPAEPLALQPVTREDGSFVAEVLRFDTLLVEDGAVWPRVLQVSAQPEEDLPPVRASVVMTDDDAALPPLRQWRGRVVLTEKVSAIYGVSLEGQVPPVPGGATDTAHATTIELVDAHGEVAWRELYKPGESFLTHQLLEEGIIGVRAVRRLRGVWPFHSHLKGPFTPGVEFTLEQALPTVALPLQGARPFSRGALCPELAPDGPCPLTDGRFTAVPIPPALQQGFTITFPEPQPIETVWWFTFRGVRLQGANAITIDWQSAETGEWVGGTMRGFREHLDELYLGRGGFGVDVGLVRALRFRPVNHDDPLIPPPPDPTLPPAILYVREISTFFP